MFTCMCLWRWEGKIDLTSFKCVDGKMLSVFRIKPAPLSNIEGLNIMSIYLDTRFLEMCIDKRAKFYFAESFGCL